MSVVLPHEQRKKNCIYGCIVFLRKVKHTQAEKQHCVFPLNATTMPLFEVSRFSIEPMHEPTKHSIIVNAPTEIDAKLFLIMQHDDAKWWIGESFNDEVTHEGCDLNEQELLEWIVKQNEDVINDTFEMCYSPDDTCDGSYNTGWILEELYDIKTTERLHEPIKRK